MSENERPALVRRSSSFGRYGGGGEKCALCAKTVYVAERAVAQDKIFHVACFRCKECNVKLTLSSWCMDPCGGLWCKPHFMQALKTSGGTLTVNTESERSPPSTPRRSDSSNGKAAATPQRPLAPATAHGETRSPAHVPSPAPTPAPSPVCTPVPAPATASPAPRSGSKIMRSSSFGRFGGGGEKCTRCNKTVYAAERVSAKDQVFHNTCFRCIECNIKLSPSNWCMDLSGGVYCKPHFMQTMRAGGGKYDFGTGGSSSSLLSSAAAAEPAAPEPAAQAPERAASGDGAASGAAARARPATPTSKSSAPPNGSPKPAASFRSRSGASSPTKQSPKSRRSRGRSKDFDKSPLPSPSMYRGAKPPPWAPNGAGAAAVGDTTNGTGSPHTPRELTRELSVSCDASEVGETPIERPRSPSFAAAAAAAARVTGAVVGSGTIAIRHKARRSEQRPQKRNPEAAKPPAATPASAPPDTLPLPDAWPPLVLLGVCGSLRAASTNAGLLRVAAVAARQRGVELRLATIGDLPLYSQDLDEAGGSTRGAVSSWRAAVSSADAVLFACPEHNYSISAALKNAIDWASRVPTQGNLWAGKAGAILSSGGGGGGVRGQQALRQIGSFIDVTFVNAPEVAIRRFEEPCFDAATGDLLPDSRWVGRVGELVERLVTLALALRASRPAPPRQDKAV